MEGTIGPAGASDEPYQAPSNSHVIEVTDLVIPAGTNWSAGHEIGVVEGLSVGQLCIAGAYLSVAAVGADLSLHFAEFTDVDTSTVLATFSPMTGRYWATDSFSGLIGDNAPSGSSPAPASLRWVAALVTSGPIAGPITVLRARATLLVL